MAAATTPATVLSNVPTTNAVAIGTASCPQAIPWPARRGRRATIVEAGGNSATGADTGAVDVAKPTSARASTAIAAAKPTASDSRNGRSGVNVSATVPPAFAGTT